MKKYPLQLVAIALTIVLYGCSDSNDDDGDALTDTTVDVAPDATESDTDSDADAGNNTEAADTSDGGDTTDAVTGDTDEGDTTVTDTDQGADEVTEEVAEAPEAVDNGMDFFLTSRGPGDGANLGGLAGADAHCAALAEEAGTSGREWRAYLSTTGPDGVNAIERIGQGPWANANGVVVATSPQNLMTANENNLNKETSISESGEIINGAGDDPNRHDILTGTTASGLASTDEGDTTCGNWTSNGEGSALVGHHDRMGGGADPTSWSSAHGSAGCSQIDLQNTGGDGLYYCFAIN